MKARNGFCTWRPLVGAAVVGALAIAVSVQGSPRVGGERDKGSGKSQASRVVTGPSAHINSAIAMAPTATITLQPVAPKTNPASSYNGSISANKLTLNAVPARAWFEIHATTWAPANLKTIQVKIDATGYSGTTSGCGAAGDLFPAKQLCTVNNDCQATVSGLFGACGPTSKCEAAAAFYEGAPWFLAPGTKICNAGFQDKCDKDTATNSVSDWIGNGVGATSSVSIAIISYTYGMTDEPGDIPTDYAPSYLGTLVLDVPATAKGTYTISSVVAETYMKDYDIETGLPIPIDLVPFVPGIIEIPCGSCCSDIGPGSTVCTDNSTKGECDASAPPNAFRANQTCAAVECPACQTNADCADGDGCTQDICNPATGVCTNPKIAAWVSGTCCEGGVITTLGCTDQCLSAVCSTPPDKGTATCVARTGLTCDDKNPCTYNDSCGDPPYPNCKGIDKNTVPCVTSDDCFAEYGVADNCVNGKCECKLEPDLSVTLDTGGKPGPFPGDLDCYIDNAKITGSVYVGASSSPISGVQFAMTYDPTCLEYAGIVPAAAFPDLVYGPIVDTNAGTIFMAVGVGFPGGVMGSGNVNVANFSFLKIGTCNSCQICFTNDNPLHTYLSDDKGQRIGVTRHCSDAINANNTVVLTVPPSIITNVDCNVPSAIETWPAPSATDSCGTSQVICRGEHASGVPLDRATPEGGGEFPLGASSFCCYAVSDYCGKIVGCPPDTNCKDGPDADGKPDGCWTVMVNDETSMDITIGLSPTSQSRPGENLTRCIKFTLFDGISEPLVFSDNVTFGGLYEFIGKSTGKVKIPGANNWSCISAQDQLHTLRSCYSFRGSDCQGGQLIASFYGDPRLGGNWLIGGNLDGWKKGDPTAHPSLDVIDILDYGTFVSQYGLVYSTTDFDTPCGTLGPNADINGDGVVDMDDYAFISMNFLTSSKVCCGASNPQTASVNAITEISIAQLRALGLGDLAVADLNGDGLLNMADMAAFDQGVRPSKTTPTKGGTRSSGSR